MNYKMDYRTCIFICCYLMSVRVESRLIKNKSPQRRFMWKQMDDTVDDLMDGVMSGARVMKHMFTDLTSSTNVRHTVSPFDYMPSETTRVKYIFRSPSGKPMKTIKIRPPKKTIKIMTVAKPIVYEGKYYKPKIKFPSNEDMRKLEKQQEKMVEGRMPVKTSAEMLAEIESEKHVNEYKLGSKPVKSRQELLAEQESEKQVNDYKHYKDFKDYKPQKPDEQRSEIVTGHITEFSEDWKPVQQQPEQQEEVRLPIPFSTYKPYALSELHTSISSSSQSHPGKDNMYPGRLHTSITASSPAHHVEKEYYYPTSKSGNKLHTSIIASSRYQTKSEKPIYEDVEHDQQLYEEAPNVHHSYEVTEYIAEESLALPLQQEYQPNTEENEKLANSSSSTTSTSTTTEEPNYPAEFLRKYRERTATAATLKSNAASRFRPSEKLLDTSWIPATRNNSYAPTSKSHRNINARTKSEKWPPELPAPAPFGTQAAASLVVESVTQGKIEQPSSEPVRSKRKKQRFVTPLPDMESESRDKPRDVRQRGRVRFGDKLNADEY